MKTNYERWVDALIEHYRLPIPTGKQLENEVYQFTVNDNIFVKVYGDSDGCVYLHSILGSYQAQHEVFIRELLQANDFSLKKPHLIIGLDKEHNLILHTRMWPIEMGGMTNIEIFEHFIDSSVSIKKHFNFD
ncbi:hypothetical protein ALQ62_200250 [Pseudomonas coronafaciens pv. zizaniae]|uniref:CesT family type III secretion system chaperone n=1 Tax=Pseudomonas coronafaciens TaxID=53409 RepID=UPI0006D62C1C|nr:CesT family type III secretion system chaperone [Pseudomonas coronafaciens]RMN24557.1 hypothetical protein ALQ62_200250 [Pseudomonas coronafaciens pv. zizaniae]